MNFLYQLLERYVLVCVGAESILSHTRQKFLKREVVGKLCA